MRKIGPWTVRQEETVFDNRWLRVVDYDVMTPTGAPGRYGVVRFKNRAIGVLPIDDEGRVPLVGQHRFPHDAYSWEAPEGGGPLDEAPLDAAKRELAEETGFSAGRWLSLTEFDVSNSVTDEKAVCFLAADLTPGDSNPDPDEILSNELVPFQLLYERIMSGDIRDGLTIVMVLMARQKALCGMLPDDIAKLLV